MVTDIAVFGDASAATHRGDGKSAAFYSLEPELKVSLEATGRVGHVRALVEITPDHLTQAHRFEFEIDQSYLPEIIRQCSAIVREYPIRGQQDESGI